VNFDAELRGVRTKFHRVFEQFFYHFTFFSIFHKNTFFMLAPIVLFAYNRPELTQQTLESLAANAEAAESTLYVFADGAKTNASDEVRARIERVREVVLSRQWCKNVHLIAAEANKGLANSVIGGVTQIVNEYGRVIVVEDDVTVSPFFLQFMNKALDTHADDPRVSGIGSWNYFCPPSVSKDNFFLRHPDSIAWATYARAWAKFNPDIVFLQKAIAERRLGRYLNMENSINLVKMLKNQELGKVDSWAVRWTASVILEGMLTFYPQFPIARHEGYAAGTHFSGTETTYDKDLELANAPLSIRPIPVVENAAAIKAYVAFARKHDNRLVRAWATIKRWFV
jgi:hypothetical protein